MQTGLLGWSISAVWAENSAELLAFRLHSGDVCQLAMALMRHASVIGLIKGEGKGKNFYRSAYHLLHESLGPWTVRRKLLYHTALFRYLRYFAIDWSWDKQTRFMKEIEARAQDLGTPGVQLETLKEQVRHYGAQGKLDDALQYFAELEALQKQHRFPRYGLPSLLRPKIHALLASNDFRDRDKTVELVYEYRAIYLGDRHYYYYATLLNWRRDLGLLFDLPEPTWGSMIFTYLPRDQ